MIDDVLESEYARVTFGIQVNNLQAALDSATRLGDTVVMPASDNGWVFKAQVKDPEGNFLSLIQADKKPIS